MPPTAAQGGRTKTEHAVRDDGDRARSLARAAGRQLVEQGAELARGGRDRAVEFPTELLAQVRNLGARLRGAGGGRLQGGRELGLLRVTGSNDLVGQVARLG